MSTDATTTPIAKSSCAQAAHSSAVARHPKYNVCHHDVDEAARYPTISRCVETIAAKTPHTVNFYMTFLTLTIYGGLFVSAVFSYDQARELVPFLYFVVASAMLLFPEMVRLVCQPLLMHRNNAFYRDVLRVEITCDCIMVCAFGVLHAAFDQSWGTGWVDFLPSLSFALEIAALFGIFVVALIVGLVFAKREAALFLLSYVLVSHVLFLTHAATARYRAHSIYGLACLGVGLWSKLFSLPEIAFSRKSFTRYIINSEQIYRLLLAVAAYLIFTDIFDRYLMMHE